MTTSSPEKTMYYAALDWAVDHHDVVVVDERGAIVLQERIAHSAEGWQKLHERLRQFGTGLPVAVETNHGLAVEELLKGGCTVYPVQPKSAARYRERKAPSGVKNDVLDAWSLADALRVDGHQWRALAPEDPIVQELRVLCRDEVTLIEQRTALVNQLQAALREYYPAALEAFEDWTKPRQPGRSSRRSPRRRCWPRLGSCGGKSSCTRSDCGAPNSSSIGWKSSRTRTNWRAMPR